MIKRAINFKKKYGNNLTQSIMTGIENSLVFLINKEPTRSPLSIGWILTYRCNSKCSYCTSWRIGMENKTPELTTNEAIDIIKQMGKLKVWMLSFTGGEPLLRKDLFELIKESKKNKIGTNMNTNGYFLEKYADKIIDSGLDTMTVSVESNSAEVHDKVRNCKNSFEKLKSGIIKIQKIKKQKKLSKPVIIVRANISKRNYKDLDKYYEYWKDLADEVWFQPIHEGGAESIFHIQKKDIDFTETDKKEYKKYMQSFFKKYPEFNKGYYKEFYNFFFNKEKMKRKYRCFAGYYILTLDPYGEVYPCAELITKFGNLKNESLINIIRGKKAKKFKEILKNRKNKCFCWYNCTGPINYPLNKVFKIK